MNYLVNISSTSAHRVILYMCSSFMNGGNIFLDNGLDANVTHVPNLDYSQYNSDSGPKRKEKSMEFPWPINSFIVFTPKLESTLTYSE